VKAITRAKQPITKCCPIQPETVATIALPGAIIRVTKELTL